MNCPMCAAELRVMNRQGIEIDVCPQCRGVWLDRGELDKIIARSKADYDDDSGEFRVPPQRGQHAPPPQGYPPQGYPPQQPYPKKRESWWSNLFDD